MIQLVVFDMAGTTVDEDNVVYKTLRAALQAGGFDFTLEQVLLHGAGKEKLQAIQDLLALNGVADASTAQDVFVAFKTRLDGAYAELDVREQPGASRVFAELRQRGIRVALNTGYDQTTAELLLKRLNWQIGRDIDALVTASQTERNRPYPDMILLAMKRLGITNPSAVAKVGDSGIDIEEGKNAGCGLTVGITTGAHSRQQLLAAMPHAVIDALSELPALLL